MPRVFFLRTGLVRSFDTGAHSLVPAMTVFILLRPNLLPMMAKRGVVLRRHR
jgi:hypothetical protein